MTQSENRVELLAPAGSMESFFAAMDSGADAVYAGLHDFSARARAKNFSLQQIEKMLVYAHSNGRRIYITLNTLVKESELPQLVDTLAALASMRVDGVIVQDMAIARLVRNYFPSIPLHASTQMTIHNTKGVQALQQLGFQRAVLARELAIDEIAKIAAATPVEIETFIHGALCFSVSGQCFFSSYLGGHSGNRGRCAQPCRRVYGHLGKQGHFFSTNDLSAIDMIPDLISVGVKSLKIEGRMKSAEYVATVVSAYRKVIDAPRGSEKEAMAAAKETLKNSFGRTPTKGFLASQTPDDIANPWQKGGTGRYTGSVKTVAGKRLSFETRTDLHVGDRLRVQPQNDMAGQAWTIREIFINRKKVMDAPSGANVEVDTPFIFTQGDSIYKVSSNEAYTLSDNACLRRLDSIKGGSTPCDLTIALESSEIKISATVHNEDFCFRQHIGELEFSKAENMEPILIAQFSKTGGTPFVLQSLSATNFPPRYIPAAKLKELRRKFYTFLEAAIKERVKEIAALSRQAALKELESVSIVQNQGLPQERLGVLIDTPRDWRYPLQNGADEVIINLTKAAIHAIPTILNQTRGSENDIIWQFPFILFDRDMHLYESTLEQLYRFGFRRFEAANLSHFQLFNQYKDIRISTWYRCFSLNSQALKEWNSLGGEAATLYIEDDKENLAKLSSLKLPIERKLIVYAPLPVMTTKIRIKDVHTNKPLTSDRGEEYCVTTRDGLQTITASTPFSLTGRHGELRRNRFSSFVIDLRQTDRAEWGTVISAFKLSHDLPGTTEFNYLQGLI